MARMAQAGQPLPAPEALGLRPAVVQACMNFQVRPVRASPSAAAVRNCILTLGGPGFRVTLPPPTAFS